MSPSPSGTSRPIELRSSLQSVGVFVPPEVMSGMRSKFYNEEPQYLSEWQRDPLQTKWGKLQLFAQARMGILAVDLARMYVSLRDITKALMCVERGV